MCKHPSSKEVTPFLGSLVLNLMWYPPSITCAHVCVQPNHPTPQSCIICPPPHHSTCIPHDMHVCPPSHHPIPHAPGWWGRRPHMYVVLYRVMGRRTHMHVVWYSVVWRRTHMHVVWYRAVGRRTHLHVVW